MSNRLTWLWSFRDVVEVRKDALLLQWPVHAFWNLIQV